MVEETNITIEQCLNIIKKRWFYLLIGILIGAIVTAAVSYFILPRMYTSSIQMYVSAVTTANSSGSVQANELTAGQNLANTCSIILQNNDVLDKLSRDLNKPYTVAQIKESLSISSVDGTEVLQISSTTKDPNLSAEICNKLSERAPDILKKYIKAGSVEPIGQAKVPSEPSAPNVKSNTVIGALVGMVLALVILILREILDNTVTNEDQLKEKFDLPVIGVLPSFSRKTNYKKSREKNTKGGR